MTKETITICESDSSTTVTLQLKDKKNRSFKLISGNNYTHPNKTLVKVKIIGDNEYVILTDNKGKKQKMDMGTFFDLCLLMKHIDDLPNTNLIGKTKVIKKKSKKKKS